MILDDDDAAADDDDAAADADHASPCCICCHGLSLKEEQTQRPISSVPLLLPLPFSETSPFI
jgi:hypothetical protein